MAIQTGGFQVRNMPQFTAPNPNLVAFTPQPVAQGLGDVFKLAQQYENLKQSKFLQAELAATQEGRIGAQQARDLSTIQLAPAQTQYALGKISADMPNVEARGLFEGEDIARNRALIPAEQAARAASLDIQTQRDLSGLVNVPAFAKYEGEKIASDLSLLGPITDARKAQALAQTAQSGNDLALAPVVRGAQEAELGLRTSQARLGQTQAPLESHAKFLKLTDEITNYKSDADRKRAGADMDMLLKNSQILENLGRVDYYDRGGASRTGPNVANQIAALQLAQQRAEAASYKHPNGDVVRGLAAYRAATRNADGSRKTVGTFLGMGTPTPIAYDPQAEAEITKSDAITAAINRLIPRLMEDFAGGPIPQTPQAPIIQVPSSGEVKISSKAEYDRLPSGTTFTGSDGKKYVKP